MKTLYLECYSGISGDMTAAALLDLGADETKLREALDSLKIGGFHLHTGRVLKNGISAFDFDVHLEANPHRETYSHTDEHYQDIAHNHEEHTHIHSHQEPGIHQHSHQAHDHGHTHRNLYDIFEIIDQSALSDRVKSMAKRIFDVVARAEAKVHGLPIEQVHFHEVGATDSIVDIVSVAFCLDDLGVQRVICSPLYEGTGTIVCAHGIIPVPAPATAEIVAESGLSLVITDNPGEMVTPTGAAIAAALSSGAPSGPVRILRTGYGAGKRNYRRPNVLRAHLIEEPDTVEEEVVQMECNIDNMTGEQYGYAMEKLLKEGALDVWFTPIQMKKNRPAILLGVLCFPQDEERLTRCILTHTGTIGVRKTKMRRTVMQRESEVVHTEYGDVDIKHSRLGNLDKICAEYESARACAERNHVPINQIYRAAEGVFRRD